MDVEESGIGLKFPFWKPVRRRFRPDAPFFEAGNIERELLAKQAKVARGFAMYECLVEGCNTKLKSHKSRQQHLVDSHKFPSSFEFFKKASPSKKHRQKARHKKLSHKEEDASTAMQVDEENVDSLVSAVSRLSTSDSPSSISFGRRHNPGLAFIPRAVHKERKLGNSIRQNNFNDSRSLM